MSAFVLNIIPNSVVSPSRHQNLVNTETVSVYTSLSAKNSFFGVLVHIAASRRHVFSLLSFSEQERQVQGKIDNCESNSHQQRRHVCVEHRTGQRDNYTLVESKHETEQKGRKDRKLNQFRLPLSVQFCSYVKREVFGFAPIILLLFSTIS